MQLAKPFKQFPVGTPVTIIEHSKPLATVKIRNTQYIIPQSYIAAPSRTTHQETIIQKMQEHIPVRIMTADEANPSYSIRISCYCGAQTNYIPSNCTHSYERKALDECKERCSKCRS